MLIESEIFALKAEGNEIKRKKIPANITSKKCRNDKGLVSRLIVSIECKVPGGGGEGGRIRQHILLRGMK